jgi:uncharacterized MAPEG superfamily protein
MSTLLHTQDYSYYAVLIACLLPYLFVGVAKFGTGRRYNNHDPRAFLEQVEGKHKRAHNAQLNSFEALPLFIAGVLIAHRSIGVEPDYLTLNVLSWCFIALRLAYGWAYITDRASLRSIIWFFGLGVSASLYFL